MLQPCLLELCTQAVSKPITSYILIAEYQHDSPILDPISNVDRSFDPPSLLATYQYIPAPREGHNIAHVHMQNPVLSDLKLRVACFLRNVLHLSLSKSGVAAFLKVE